MWEIFSRNLKNWYKVLKQLKTMKNAQNTQKQKSESEIKMAAIVRI